MQACSDQPTVTFSLRKLLVQYLSIAACQKLEACCCFSVCTCVCGNHNGPSFVQHELTDEVIISVP